MDTTLADPLIGRVLDGRYAVEERIARGGMATVYRAIDLRLDRVVAVKVMHPALAEDSEFVSRFIREAKSAARLSHPGAVAVFDQGDDAGIVFLVMEHVPGCTLRDVLADSGRLSAREALRVQIAMLGALDAAHRAGLVHRDIKPENVLIAPDGQVKVADFGLARAVKASTLTATTGPLIGTAAYLSPEQFDGGTADPRSDVYAAGIVLFEMLTGVPPYHGETALSIGYRHLHEDVPAPSQLVPDVPAAVDELVARATRRDPGGRPVDAGAFLAETRLAVERLPDEPVDVGHRDTQVLDSGSARVLRRQAGYDGRAHTLVVPPEPRVLAAAPPVPPPSERPLADDSEDGPAPRRRRLRVRRGLVVFMMVLLAAAAAAAVGWRLAAPPPTTLVPTLVGLDQATAQQRARAARLQLSVGDKVFSETVKAGLVVSQDPVPDQRTARSTAVTVHLSKGQERYRVPDLSNFTVGDAHDALAKVHLAAAGTVVHQYSETVTAGLVLSTRPAAGTPEKRGTDVTLVVSNGREPITITDQTGQPADQAAATLTKAGFKVTTSDQFSDTVAKGAVISQTPPDGTGHRGDTIVLTVSKGPDLVAVPSLRGQQKNDAVAALKALGLKAHPVTFPFGSGVVIDQTPKAGSMVKRGSTVTLLVD